MRRRRWYVVLAVIAVLLGPAAAIMVRCALAKKAPAEAVVDPREVAIAKARIAGYGRSGAATFLTFPEWLIVYDAEEYAAFVKRRRPSGFPYFRSVPRYWLNYWHVCDAACGRFPFDGGDHLMLGVIGVSASVENVIKGVYENTIGRLSELLGTNDTEEDRLAAEVAADYARFIHRVPWYDYPFGRAFRRLWTEPRPWGAHPVRKWERRFALSLEYGIKAGYGAVIRFGTKSVYGNEDEWIHARARHIPPHAFDDARVKRVATFADASHIVEIKRYEPFTAVVESLVADGARFEDIAGNRRILITALGTSPPPMFDTHEATLLFVSRELADNRHRVAIDARVEALGAVFARLRQTGLTVEHVYDY